MYLGQRLLQRGQRLQFPRPESKTFVSFVRFNVGEELKEWKLKRFLKVKVNNKKLTLCQALQGSLNNNLNHNDEDNMI